MTMALRVLRIVPTPPSKSCFARHYVSIRGSLCVAQDTTVSASATPTFPQRFRHHGHVNSCNLLNSRSFSSNSADSTVKPSDEESDLSKDDEPLLLYEGPFASLTLTLKRVSLTSAVIAIVGLPALSFFSGSGVPATGQLAVIATAGVTAVGSTALMGYCFSSYVHTLERLPISFGSENNDGDHATRALSGDQNLVRIITRDILARRVETIFDPTSDVGPPPNNNSRPFCNFMVRGLPMYVHPEMIHDYKLRVQLVGDEPQQDDSDARNKKRNDDDEFL